MWWLAAAALVVVVALAAYLTWRWQGGRVDGLATFDPSNGKCQGQGPVMFGASPFELGKLATIQPMGQMIYDHVTPIDHGYMFGVGGRSVPFDSFGIYSPAKGYVVEMSRTQRSGPENFIDYALTIEFSCTHYVHYSNMSSFAPRLLQAGGGLPALNILASVRIPVREGELVGRTGPYGIDLYVQDKQVKLTGYIVPEHYASESGKLHSADFFNYVKEPLKSKLLAKNLRQANPRFGKIDYDIDGRLSGNWFQVGTYGYKGSPPGQPAGGEGYWRGHAAFAPDALDPSGFIVSLGNWPGGPAQFAVRGNKPNPKDVSVASRVVKYELAQPDHVVASSGRSWDRTSYVKGLKLVPGEGPSKGVVLLQLVGPRQLKLEVFAGRTADEVVGFTKAAVMYER